MKVDYQKIKSLDDFQLEKLNCSQIQLYSPILEKLFVLNDQNNNKIMLKSGFSLKKILTQVDYNIYTCKISNGSIVTKSDLFFKFSTLFDPIKYSTEKMNAQYNDFASCLPTYSTCDSSLSYINDYNNVSYVDGLFTFFKQ